MSPSTATARQYEACNPSVVHSQLTPSSRLHPKPTAAAATTRPASPATTSWTSSSGGTTFAHDAPRSVDRQTPPTCTFTSQVPVEVTAIDRRSGNGPAG